MTKTVTSLEGKREEKMPPIDYLVRPEGLEPPTLGSEVRCSIQLSYGRIQLFQALQRRSCQGRDISTARSFLTRDILEQAQTKVSSVSTN